MMNDSYQMITNRQSGNPEVDGKLIHLVDPLHEKYTVAYDIKGQGDGMTYSIQEYDHRPTTKEIVDLLSSVFNEECDEEILTGSSYTTLEDEPVTKPLYLSQENQFNWSTGFLLTNALGGANLPEFIKIGDDDDFYIYKIETLDQYKHFVLHVLTHIKTCLNKCWQKKANIDLSKYTLDDGEWEDGEDQ